MSVGDVDARPGPRKLLALDGGGIRGIITIEILAEIERQLQQALGEDDSFVLADYFDYIAGTSTGAIIGACLAMGMRVGEIRPFYVESGPLMFSRSKFLQRFRYRYQDKPLGDKLKSVLGANTTLGDPAVRTYLMMVLRNATTDSPWPLSNNPRAMYNDRKLEDCNLDFPLWQLVRASTAAPVFFPPEVIKVGTFNHVFVDGGVTMYNNPAFHLFLMATSDRYRLGWPTGEENMLLVSIGTGAAAAANGNLRPGQMNLLYNATSIPSALMGGASVEQDLLCRMFGNCVFGAPIDSEIGDLIGGHGPCQPRLFRYARYNADLSERGLARLELRDIQPRSVQVLDAIQAIPQLTRVGQAVAKSVDIAHFSGFVPPPRPQPQGEPSLPAS